MEPMRIHAAADLEVLVRLPGDEKLAAGVDGEDAVEFLGRDILDVTEGYDAAVGAHDVELAERLDGVLKQPDDLVDDRHVSLDGDRIRPALLDGADNLLRRVRAVGIVDNHLAPRRPSSRAISLRCRGLQEGEHG